MSMLQSFLDMPTPRGEELDLLRANSGIPFDRQIVPCEFFDKFLKIWEKIKLNDDVDISTDKEKFQVNIDVEHFAPEEINVKVVDGHVVAEGKHEERKDQHGYVSRQFVRRYPLPEGCLPDTVEAKLSSDGVLIITAPMVLALPSTGEKIIPIKHTGPVKLQIASHELEK